MSAQPGLCPNNGSRDPQDGSTEGVPFPDGHSPTVDGAPRMPVPPGEDVAAVLALAPPELRQCETVVAMERLIGDRDEELAFLRERCVQFEVQRGLGSGVRHLKLSDVRRMGYTTMIVWVSTVPAQPSAEEPYWGDAGLPMRLCQRS